MTAETIQVRCPKCGTIATISGDAWGQRVECAGCGVTFIGAGKPGSDGVVVGSMESSGDYLGLLFFSACVMGLGVVWAWALLMVARFADIGYSLLMVGGALAGSFLTGMVGLAIRDIAINSRATREATETLCEILRPKPAAPKDES